jgi:hypothetical protein
VPHRPFLIGSPGCPRRLGLQGCLHDTGDLVDLIYRLSSTPWSDVPQTVQALVAEALSPQNHRVSIHRKPLRDCDIGLSRSGSQNDAATQSYLLWSAVSRSPLLEFPPLDFGKLTRLPHALKITQAGSSV